MTLQEFSIEFDILYNNISSNQAPGLTEYEKSVFLTQAQEALILDLYKGTTGDSFETTEEVTRYLNSLVKTSTFSELTTTQDILNTYTSSVSIGSEVWFITYQAGNILLEDNSIRDVIVIPARQDSLFKDLNNPFRRPNKNRILSISEDGNITLYSKYPINKFYFKYLERPYPIILESCEGFSIAEKSEPKEITWLPKSLHTQVLLRAVQIAKTVWQS